MILPLVEKLRAFMAQHVFPAEPAMHDPSVSLSELMRPIQQAARDEGLWMPQIAESQGGMGLSLLEHAIVNGMDLVEAGAQGEHKIQRGYMPVTTYSAHWIRDPALSDAVANFLARERRAIDHEQNILESFAPFRKDGETGPAA